MARNDAKVAVDSFCGSYDGVFGRFEADPDNDGGFAVAVHGLKSRFVSASMVMVSTEDPDGTYAEKLEFVKEKSKPTPMGKSEEIQMRFGFDEEYGTLNNFSKMGTKGGIMYFAARKGDAVVCMQMFSMKAHVSDDDLGILMDAVLGSLD